ncbi:hypothetical protein Fcan01_25579 [Folsomia candida]|uniref:Odorant receptor n=1 Tax=Folsomia candida TaxID=158441 RepID=A0A226D3D5_FOLCA|nr:hypothetical protein Fcan01_25579 [Folsomia candida]
MPIKDIIDPVEMVKFHEFIPYARQCLWVNSWYGSNPVKWNSKATPTSVNLFVPSAWLKSPVRIFLSVTIFIYFSVMSLRLGITLLEGRSDTMFGTNVVAGLIWIVVFCGISFGRMSFSREGEIAAWLNTLIYFERKEFEGSEQLEKAIKTGLDANFTKNPKLTVLYWMTEFKEMFTGSFHKFIIHAATSVPLVNPVLMSVQIWRAPCTRPLLVSLREDCTHSVVTNPCCIDWLVRVIFHLLDSWAIGLGFALTPFTGVFIIFIGAVCVADYQAGCKKSICRGSLTKSLNFYQKHLHLYRTTFLLSSQHNQLVRGNLVNLMVTMCSLAILSLYSCIALHSVMPLPLTLFSLTLVLEIVCLVHGGMYTTYGKLYNDSVAVIDTFKRIDKIGRNKYLRRIVKSMQPTKIKFGGAGNFLEASTALQFNRTTVDQAVSLVLMRG